MTVRWRILILVSASLGFVALIIVTMTLAQRSTDHFVGRVQGLHARLAVAAALDTIANRYATQVARTLLVGDDQTAALEDTRASMYRTLAELLRVTRAEVNTLSGMKQIQGELPELVNSERLSDVFNAIDEAAKQAIALQRKGRTKEAVDLYARQVAFPLANELQPWIDHELEDERGEMTTESANIARVQFEVRVVFAVLTLLAAVCLALLGAYLYRSVTRPLDNFRRVIRAIAAGRFEHHVETAGNDEFSALSATFNDMADTLAEQRGSLTADRKRLSDEVETRTRELSGALAQLRTVDSRQAQILGEVSHQLRTPLTIIRGEADVALRGKHSPEDQHETLLRIQGQAQSLGQLLEDLISYARSDAQGHQLVAERISLEEVAAAAVQDCEILANAREVKIDSAFCKQACWVNGDFGRLKQALVIGLDNAVKHSPPGATICVETAREGGEVRISITDEGPGIAAEDLPHVFERFFRSHTEGELLDSGLGIGLSIAKDIVEQHAGSISLENRPKSGARFQIVLPAFGGQDQ
jgi:two-component system OmpR family sensor kinase